MEIKDCVVLLAGLGTRCYPFAYSVPKCMIPVGTKPVIEYIVDEAKLSGIENIYFVLPKFMDTKVVLKHFENQKRLLEILKQKNSPYYQEIKQRKFPNIKAIYSKFPNGSGGAILDCQKYLKDKYFAVANGDDIFFGEPVIKQIIEESKKHNACVVSSMPINVKENHKFGMIQVHENDDFLKITNIIEKPKNNNVLNQAIIGRYILNDKIFDILKHTPKVNGEIYLTTAIGTLAQSENIICCPIKSQRFDCGCKEGILKANLQIQD